MAATKKSSQTYLLLIGLLLPACVCVFCVFTGIGTTVLSTLGLAGWVIIGEARPAQQTAEAFFSALRDEEWDIAYAMCTPSLQEALGSPEALAQQYGGDRRPITWSFSSWHVSTENGVKQAELGGTLTTVGGEKFEFSIELRARTAESGEIWEVQELILWW